MKRFALSLLALLLALMPLSVFTLPASAQGNDPPIDVNNLPSWLEYDSTTGQITFNADGLNPGEAINMPPPDGYLYFQSIVPGTDMSLCVGCMQFNTYTTPTGETVIVPTAWTAIVMAVSGQSPFDSEPDFYLENGVFAIAQRLGVFEEMGLSSDHPTAEEIQWALQNMDPLTMLKLNLAINDPNSPLFTGVFFWASGIYQFTCNPFSGQCPEAEPPQPTVNDIREQICQGLGLCKPKGDCPRDWVIQQRDPQYAALKIAPANPVVVGQDPSKRGVDLRVGVTVFPVVVQYTYEYREPGERVCHWFPKAGQGGCGGGYDRLDSPTGAWYEDGQWGVENTEKKECRRDTLTFPDRINTLSIKTGLSSESIDWINSDLAAKYPGAKARRPLWTLYPSVDASPASGGFSAAHDQASFLWKAIPFVDPGQYSVTIGGGTKGTPFTPPRVLSFNEAAFPVAAEFVALTK